MSCETGRIGSIFGHDVQLVNGTYVFGCGAVKIPQKTMQNFLAELHKRFDGGSTQQEKDFAKVMGITRDRGISMNNADVQRIFRLFEKKPVKRVAKETPAKKRPTKKK